MIRAHLSKVIYGALFVVVLPLTLVLWAQGARDAVRIAALHEPALGAMLTALGVAIVLTAIVSLWRYGGGLPMNVFPPPRFVENGIYGLVPHPIYGGFVIACAGVAIFFGSSSGLWLVTPSVALGSAALVLGYELPDLRNRFGARAFSLWLPMDRPEAPSLLERFRVYLVVLLPWLALYELMWRLGGPDGVATTYLPFENRLPVMEQTEIIYASTYLVVVLAPMLAVSGHALRRFAQRGLIAMALIFPLYLLLPVFVPPRAFKPATLIGYLLLLERTPYSGIAAFPSFHVAWALIAASALAEGGRWKKIFWWTWAVLVAVSCVTTGMHSIADVLAGAVAYVLVIRAREIWMAILRVAEWIANSWKEWRIGPVRIINHGGFATAGILIGISLIDALLGPGLELLTVSIFLCATIGAALWAQWVEGSPALLRPLGFYGGMLGAILGGSCALFMPVNLWVVLAAICIAAPWIQGIGRLRCLVQGCCHGRAAVTVPGIRYTHPRSRVCRLAHLAGASVHATQVYSILWNVVVGLALLRLLQLHSSTTLICGVYLLLSGAGRFVEEAYRGEPQTRIVFGLRFYQWIAVLIVITGAVMTCIHGPAMAQGFTWRISSILVAVGCGAVAWFATGVDFPESSRRFARLT
ncbi:MAG: prolipoprotein diacylglyceryl transferase family protein [Terracidiphilus sp.]|jgi:membrane-associated phospholipid phosphatase